MPRRHPRFLPLFVVMLLVAPRLAEAIWLADYLPTHGYSFWTYTNVDDPLDTFTRAVFESVPLDGVQAVKLGSDDDYIVLSSTGRVLTVYAEVYEDEVSDFEPDLELGWLTDGDLFAGCVDAVCDTNLVRDWQAIDPALRALYDLDPAWDDVWLIAAFDADEAPTFQNSVVTSNLPAGWPVPVGAVTELEWYQRDLGLVAVLGIDAASGGFREFYQLTDWLVGVPNRPPDLAPARLEPNRPNPFNPGTTLVVTVRQEGPLRLEVVDLRGRLVRELRDGTLAAGRHEVAWDGRDHAGWAVPSGTYLCRLTAAGMVQTRTLSLVK